jgi:hypothetical protein
LKTEKRCRKKLRRKKRNGRYMEEANGKYAEPGHFAGKTSSKHYMIQKSPKSLNTTTSV